MALALLVAFVPRRPDARQVAALGAAVLIVVQLAATHWFYLYVVWFVPFVFVAVFGAYRERLVPAGSAGGARAGAGDGLRRGHAPRPRPARRRLGAHALGQLLGPTSG